jgi:hypothetical protein
MIKNVAYSLAPDLYTSRVREAEAQLAQYTSSTAPVFFYNSVMFPGETLQLHLFEPRYKV